MKVEIEELPSILIHLSNNEACILMRTLDEIDIDELDHLSKNLRTDLLKNLVEVLT